MDTDIINGILHRLARHDASRGLVLRNGPHPVHCPYSELDRLVRTTAAALRHAGIGAGSRVIVPFATTLETITGFLALLGMGALPLSVKPMTASGGRQAYEVFLHDIASRFNAQAVLDAPGLDQLMLPLPRIKVDSEFDGDADYVQPRADDIAFVQFSSGTTSEPKGVPIRHAQLIAQLALIADHDGRCPEDVGASWLPLYHDMGLVGALLTPLYRGHTLHLDTPTNFLMDPIDWISHLASDNVSVTALPNFGMAYALRRFDEDSIGLAEQALASLRCIYVGSDSINSEIIDSFATRLAPYGLRRTAFSPCYGMAEAVLMVSCKPVDQHYRVDADANDKMTVSVGPVLESFEAEIREPGGAICQPGTVGEIHLRGGTLATDYFEDARTLRGADGFYATGDLGYLKDGELYITGRSGDRIKINGQNYYLPDFEHALASDPGLRSGSVAVIQSGDRLLVLAEPRRAGTAAERSALRQRLSECLMTHCGVKVDPEDILLVRRGQLQRTSSGKLRRNAINQAWLDGCINVITD